MSQGELWWGKRTRLREEAAAAKKEREEHRKKHPAVVDPRKTIPKEMMPHSNRHNRRYMAKLQRLSAKKQAKQERVALNKKPLAE